MFWIFNKSEKWMQKERNAENLVWMLFSLDVQIWYSTSFVYYYFAFLQT